MTDLSGCISVSGNDSETCESATDSRTGIDVPAHVIQSKVDI